MNPVTGTHSLPQHSDTEALEAIYQDYLQQLKQSAFAGDIDASYGGRLLAGTDNSVYQTLPQAVLYPRDEAALQQLLKLAHQPQFKAVRFSPRGGGTGTNGQSLTQGIVVDLSRYFNQVLEVNAEEGWVRVQSGVVKDQLNDVLRPSGWFFSPDLSTSNRATIGGMINTDASGQGSLVYGKTSDHVASLNTVLLTGEKLVSEPVALADAQETATQDSTLGRIYQQVLATCVGLRHEIEAKFPPLNRFLTGYDLNHAYVPETNQIDISRLIAGSEGTLGFVTEAKLQLTRIPQHKVLVNVKYSDFQAALRHAPFLVKARATSVETIDSKVLNLARQDIIWHQVSPHLSDVAGQTMNGINMVEFTALDANELEEKLSQLCARLDETLAATDTAGVIGYQICRDAKSIQTIYAMRKKSVGLLGATKGKRKPVAFAEDTAVPPEKLADFIAEFRQLLDDHDLQYGMFGHVDAGVLHVRPALDLTDEADVRMLRTISDKVAQLTAKYGGLMWGEHGKGYRSEYAPAFFGEQLFTELQKIKACFDPHNRLNPGKICTPYQSDEQLVSVDAQKRGFFDRQIPLTTREAYQPALDCNGNGLCFNYDTASPMCPSFKVTADRRYSPKGRAGLMREWLRLNEQKGYDSTQLPRQKNGLSKVMNSWGSGSDFNHEVKASMDKCLACKACSSQCPVKVDVPTFRSSFLAHYHSRYRRPLKDYLVKTVEQTAPALAKFPRLSNMLSHNAVSQWVLKHVVGYVDAPRLSVPNLTTRWQKHQWQSYSVAELAAVVASEKQSVGASQPPMVVIVQDAFTSFYEAELVEAFGILAEKLGYRPVLLDFMGNGKALHVKGYLAEFEKTAAQVATQLNRVHELELPMVGLDASTTLCFRDEYKHALGAKLPAFHVATVHEWLQQSAVAGAAKAQPAADNYFLLSHCTEQTALASSPTEWQAIFAQLGLQLTPVSVGCCGMAGTFGHERVNLADSQKLFAMSWEQVLLKHGAERVVATGFSCRSQVQRIKQQRVEHPLQLLAKAL